ncbi:MAG: FAD-dependent oxidoreductase [Phycisphaerales bacterium]|nr:FAD-dependent oxidoreductase [Phycisphaerales bacterium]
MITTSPGVVYDVVVIGAGPAGSVAALELARAGRRVLVIDRQTFPRFRIGESLLPHTQRVIRELGLLDRIKDLPHVRKLGLEISFGDVKREPTAIPFDVILGDREKETFNIRGEVLDQMLSEAAAEAGAEIRYGESVESIDRLEHGDVRLRTTSGEIRARWLVDASGSGCVVGRHLGQRVLSDQFRHVAYFEHFTGVDRPSGEFDGFASLAMCREGWFWVIPLDEEVTSIGAVLDTELARHIPVPANQRLQWCIEHCPIMKKRMVNAKGPEENRVISDFCYTCEPYAGPGYFMVGDAAAFIDPVWSTGVSLGLEGGRHAARQINRVLDGRARPDSAVAAHHAWITRYRRVFMELITHFYDHSFRELLVAGDGPFGVHRALVTLLAGEVFDGFDWSVRWRWDLLKAFSVMNRYRALHAWIRPHSMLVSGGISMPSPDYGIIGRWHRRQIAKGVKWQPS